MKKKFIRWLIGSAAVMLLLPWTTVTFAKSDAGMAISFLLFFAINPIYFITLGAFAGKNIKGMWSLPFFAATLFLLGVWIFFDLGEGAFLCSFHLSRPPMDGSSILKPLTVWAFAVEFYRFL